MLTVVLLRRAGHTQLADIGGVCLGVVRPAYVYVRVLPKIVWFGQVEALGPPTHFDAQGLLSHVCDVRGWRSLGVHHGRRHSCPNVRCTR